MFLTPKVAPPDPKSVQQSIMQDRYSYLKAQFISKPVNNLYVQTHDLFLSATPSAITNLFSQTPNQPTKAIDNLKFQTKSIENVSDSTAPIVQSIVQKAFKRTESIYPKNEIQDIKILSPPLDNLSNTLKNTDSSISHVIQTIPLKKEEKKRKKPIEKKSETRHNKIKKMAQFESQEQLNSFLLNGIEDECNYQSLTNSEVFDDFSSQLIAVSVPTLTIGVFFDDGTTNFRTIRSKQEKIIKLLHGENYTRNPLALTFCFDNKPGDSQTNLVVYYLLIEEIRSKNNFSSFKSTLRSILQSKTMNKIVFCFKAVLSSMFGVFGNDFLENTLSVNQILDPQLLCWMLDTDAAEKPKGRDNQSLITFDMDTLGLKYSFSSQPFDDSSNDFSDIFPSFILDLSLVCPFTRSVQRMISQQNLVHPYNSLVFPSTLVIARIQANGVGFEPLSFDEKRGILLDKMEKIENEAYEEAGTEFLITSPQQVGEILFEKMKLPYAEPVSMQARSRARQKYSTNEEVLQLLINFIKNAKLNIHLPEYIIQYRHLHKLLSTYIDPFLNKMIEVEEGYRVFCDWNQVGTATGRLSCSEPNLQNLPRNDAEVPDDVDIRGSFIPKPGCIFLSVDYRQFEIRVLALLSGDTELIKVFSNPNEDFYIQVAKRLLNKNEVTSVDREQAKHLIIASIYGQGIATLAHSLKISDEEASKLMNSFYSQFTGIRDYIAKQHVLANREHKVYTWSGRFRNLALSKSSDEANKSKARRQAVNTAVQGSAADIMMKAMLSIQNEIDVNHYKASIVLQIHDELILEVDEAEDIPSIALMLRTSMETAVPDSPLPFTCTVKKGNSYSQLKQLALENNNKMTNQDITETKEQNNKLLEEDIASIETFVNDILQSDVQNIKEKNSILPEKNFTSIGSFVNNMFEKFIT